MTRGDEVVADLTVNFLGKTLRNPFVLGSGPLTYNAEALIAAWEAGIGAVVTKTLRRQPADNPYPHMVDIGRGTLFNAEKWADLTAEQWIEEEIPTAKKHGVVVIASVGHTPEEAEELVGPVENAGADFIELVSYEESTMIPMVEKAKERVKIPVIAKLSPNWPHLPQVAARCLAAGADAITAADSYGPVLRLDVRTARPLLGSPYGFGWLTGACLKPIALRAVAEICLANPGVKVIGLGGVSNGEDALEMLLAGASLVGICSVAISRGLRVVGSLLQELSSLLDELNYSSVIEASGRSLPYLVPEEQKATLKFSYDPEKCTECMLCVTRCPYGARQLKNRNMELDEEKCRNCGYCVSVCRAGALTSDRLRGWAL